MSDAYLTISKVAADQNMRQRVAACAAQEGEAAPENWAFVNAFRWAAQPGWAAAWDYALAAGNPEPGADSAVIQDSQILAAVQVLRAPAAPPVIEE